MSLTEPVYAGLDGEFWGEVSDLLDKMAPENLVKGLRNLSGDQCETDKVGRRDWTRTNDPHHVKVVL